MPMLVIAFDEMPLCLLTHTIKRGDIFLVQFLNRSVTELFRRFRNRRDCYRRGVLVDAAHGDGDCGILRVHLDSFLSWEG